MLRERERDSRSPPPKKKTFLPLQKALQGGRGMASGPQDGSRMAHAYWTALAEHLDPTMVL